MQIGKGGMGEVYRARDTKLGRNVALKILPDAFARDPDRLARFTREAQTLAALNHPNIAHIHGLEESKGIRALVMELVDGEDLSQRIERGPIPVLEALPIARQIADALDAAHERGIVHRDLKPANIVLTPDGAVKVLDFGLAKVESSNARFSSERDLTHSPTIMAPTIDGVLLGTAPYMSPEQARGKAVDKRTDIWAFGCVLYEMLTARRAFPGETLTDTLAAILEHQPDWSRLPTTISPAARRLLSHCLEKDPRHRLRDIGDLRIALDDSAAIAEPTSQTRRDRWSVLWIVAGVTAAAAFAMGRLLHVSEPVDPTRSFTRVVRVTSGPSQEKGAAISPDGKWIVYLSDARGPMDVWVKFLAGGEAANLTASSQLEITTGTGITGLQIAPDGARVVVMARPAGSRGQFETWEIPAPLPGVPRKLLDAREFGIHWSPDGRQMTFIRAGGTAGDALFVADADGANRKELIPARGGLHVHWPAWARDGFIYFIHTFATVLNLDQGEIYRIDARGGALQSVVSTSRRAMYPLPMPDGNGLIYAANPGSAELSLWWRPMNGGAPKRITMGIGEYAEPQISTDGRTMIATLYELRQGLNRIAVTDGQPAHMVQLTDGYGGDLDPALSAATDQLVFTSSRSGSRNLWTAMADGTGARPLTTGSALDEQPAFSPNGRQVAFISDRSGRRGIWIVGADGGTARKILDAPALGSLTWSADGRQLIYAGSSEGWPTLWTATIASGEIKPLGTPGAKAAVQPARCPTRDVIAYLEPPTETGVTTRIGFINSSGQPMYALPPPPIGPGFANGSIAWAPDGRRLAAVSGDTAQPTSIWIVDPDAANPYRKLIELPPGPRIRGVTWTRDGAAVIVGKHETSSHIIMLDQAQ